MNNINRISYIEEREYTNVSKCSEKEREYWEQIIGKENFGAVEEMYGATIEQILYGSLESETVLSKYNSFFANIDSTLNEEIEISDIEPGKEIIFSNYLRFFLKHGKKVLSEKMVDNTHSKEIEKAYIRNLMERILNLSMGTLMFEMYLEKEEGSLKGNNHKEEYNDYNNRFLSNNEYIEGLMKVYPELFRLLIESIEHYSSNYAILAERIEKDYTLLINEFCTDKNDAILVSIEPSGSDSHRNGNSVSILHFSDNTSIIYKPRSIKADKIFQNFQLEISKECKLKLLEYKIIDRGEYGWEEFIENRSCTNLVQVENYYYRMGILICCSYVLNVYDIHSENLIAMNEYPVIIDAENLMCNYRLPEEKTGRLKVNMKIKHSVLSSGILPLYKYNKNGKGLNMSAINGKGGDEYPIYIPVLKNIGTSEMHYEYERPVSQSNSNLVKLCDEVILPQKYIEVICEGFHDCYQFCLDNKNKLIALINEFEDVYVRHLIQDTQRYSLLLHTSYNPDFLQDAKDRNLFLCTLLNNYDEVQCSLEVVKSEIRDILNMDVPYFIYNTSKKDLYDSRGKRIEDYFEKTAIEIVNEKILHMSKIDEENQLRFLRIILTDLDDIKVVKQKENMYKLGVIEEVSDPSLKMRAALKLYHLLEDTALYGDNNIDINWIGITSVGEVGNTSWSIHPLNTYFYEGVSGIAIFCHAMTRHLKITKSKLCEALDNTLFQYTDEICMRKEGLENESGGIFAGEASIVYAYELLYSITKEPKYLEYATKHSVILRHTITNDKSNDIVYGNAGALIAFLHLYDLTNNIEYLEVASKVGEILISNQKENGWEFEDGAVLAGFSHGIAGIVYSLALLYSRTYDSRLLSAAINGIQNEDLLYKAEIRNWIDNRKDALESTNESYKSMAAWCHGAPGILLSRCKMINLINDESFVQIASYDIKKALESTVMYGFTDNDCLCHGNLGNTEILLEYAQICNDKNMLKFSSGIRNKIANNILDDKYDCARAYLYGFKMPGFMTGISGMGYSLLRDVDSDLPCILSLEI